MSDNPPDNTTVESGEWNVDIEVASDEYVTGDTAIKFLDTTPAANPKLATGYTTPTTGPGTSPGPNLLITAQVRADDNGDDVKVYLEQFDDALALTGTTYAKNGPVTAIDTWERVSAIAATSVGSANFARLVLEKEKTAFNAWFDDMDVIQLPRYLEAQRVTSTQSVATATWTTIVWNNHNQYGVDSNTATGVISILEAGEYRIEAALNLESCVDQQMLRLAIKKNSGVILYGPIRTCSGAQDCGADISTSLLLAQGDTIEVQLYHTAGSNKNVSKEDGGGGYLSWVRVTQVR